MCTVSFQSWEKSVIRSDSVISRPHTYLMCYREHNCLHQLLYLLIEATNVTVVLCRLLIHLHGLDSGVILCWQRVQNEVGVLQQTNSNSGRPMSCLLLAITEQNSIHG